ncbi:hypothetical protein DITRI_Ditri19aG0066600 [Diplodiscus trichospermus]
MAAPSFISAVTKRLEGKVALITGGASDIGKCTAKVFARHGAKIVIADIQDELGHSVCEAIGPSNCSYVHCNITDENHIKNAVDKTVAAHGKLDIMFNNAGIVDPNKARIIDNEKSDFERVLSVNVTGVFLGIKHAARHAVLGLTRNAAVELGQFGIRVNGFSPFALATPLARGFVGVNDEELEKGMGLLANLKGVTLKAEDVANAALYLASEEGRYVSGHNLFIDGGFSIVNPSFHMYPDDS